MNRQSMCICTDPTCDIPYGTCHCGCGGSSPLCPQTALSRGYVRGNPMRYIAGHQRIIRTRNECMGRFRIQGVYCRIIHLGRGFVSIVNEDNYLRLNKYKWRAQWDSRGKCYYAVRWSRYIGGERHIICMHREVLDLPWDDMRKGDHVETKNTLLNIRENLRVATHAENCWNSERMTMNSSGCRGVDWYKKYKQWRSRIMVNGKSKMLGYFDTKEAAYDAYCAAAKLYQGQFMRVRRGAV